MESEDLELVPKSFTLSKNERLRSKKVIKRLFSLKSSDFIFPFKFYYLANPDLSSNQLLISIPKRAFKRSVDRHLLARRVKESYRLNKHQLSSPIKYHIALIYVSKDILSFKDIEKKLYLTLQRINIAINENHS